MSYTDKRQTYNPTNKQTNKQKKYFNSITQSFKLLNIKVKTPIALRFGLDGAVGQV